MKREVILFCAACLIGLFARGGDDVAGAAATNAVRRVKRPVRVTSSSTWYDRKAGLGVLTGNVFVDDEEYQLHADKAFLFMNSSNDLNRVVAVGNVALTNETKRAYGMKASYYRDTGLVILYGPTNGVAEVRDERPEGAQVVRGRKIKFWIGLEQVEVVEAEIQAPVGKGGLNQLKRLKEAP